jgi:hypothetical protein
VEDEEVRGKNFFMSLTVGKSFSIKEEDFFNLI